MHVGRQPDDGERPRVHRDPDDLGIVRTGSRRDAADGRHRLLARRHLDLHRGGRRQQLQHAAEARGAVSIQGHADDRLERRSRRRYVHVPQRSDEHARAREGQRRRIGAGRRRALDLFDRRQDRVAAEARAQRGQLDHRRWRVRPVLDRSVAVLMKKLLAGVAAAGIVALVVLIWIQMHETVAAAPAPKREVAAASDEFFYKFDDLQPSMLTRNAAKCYTGGLHRVHRNQKVKLAFTNRIVNGEVTVADVHVVADETTIDDPEMVECFRREVAATHWHDDALPDWSAPDELVIRPERGMKKFTKENLEYEGSGPDFTYREPGT